MAGSSISRVAAGRASGFVQVAQGLPDLLHIAPCRPKAASATIYGMFIRARCVRICANKVVAGVRVSTPLPNIRQQDTRQFASAQQIDQLEGLAVARPWGFESPLPHHL
jgi:hypothetical protein